MRLPTMAGKLATAVAVASTTNGLERRTVDKVTWRLSDWGLICQAFVYLSASGDVANVTVVGLLVVVVLDLHDLVAGGEGPAEPLHLAITGRIEGGLQLDVQRACAHTTAVHRTEHLDVSNGIEAEAARDPGLHKFDDASNCSLRVFGWYEVEVALRSGWAEIRDRAPVDAVGNRDDATLGGLPEYFGEAHYRHGAR
jgi:hypothetical protein